MNVNGRIAEMRFAEYLLRQGCEIAFTESGPADLVWRAVGGGSSWRSAQIKKVYTHKGSPCVELRHRRSKAMVRYEPEDADYLVCVQLRPETIWVIPMELACWRTQLHLVKSWDGYRL